MYFLSSSSNMLCLSSSSSCRDLTHKQTRSTGRLSSSKLSTQTRRSWLTPPWGRTPQTPGRSSRGRAGSTVRSSLEHLRCLEDKRSLWVNEWQQGEEPTTTGRGSGSGSVWLWSSWAQLRLDLTPTASAKLLLSHHDRKPLTNREQVHPTKTRGLHGNGKLFSPFFISESGTKEKEHQKVRRWTWIWACSWKDFRLLVRFRLLSRRVTVTYQLHYM